MMGKPYYWRVLSALFTNISAGWYFTMLTTGDILVMVANASFGTLALLTAFELEKKSGKK